MKKLIPVFISLLFLFSKTEVKATHVMGMDIQWKSLGSDTYNVTLVVYRRCTDGAATMGSGDGASLQITSDSCANSNTVNKGTFITYFKDDITPTCLSQQKLCPMSGGSGVSTASIPVGIERHTWVYKVYLGGANANCCWYKMRWQLCCRNSNITTGLADADFFSESWLNRCLKVGDNSPEFKNPPIEIRCAGQDVVYNHGVYDADGDSLSYAMAAPLGGSFISPWSYDYPLSCLGANNPNPNANPPTGFNLNASTGDLSFRPMQTQITVLKTMVTEWRKDSVGIYRVIGKTARDMQFIIIQTCNNKLPTLTGPYTYDVCVNEQICITLNTNDQDLSDTTHIYWNKGIPGGTWMDNNDSAKHASGTFCWTPDSTHVRNLPYSFTVNMEDNHCPLVGKSARSITLNVKAKVKPSITRNNNILTSTKGTTYQWYLNDTLITGAINQTYTITKPGYYKVKMALSNGCPLMSDSFLFIPVGIKINDFYSKINISPNPFQNQLHISLADFEKPVLISVFDIQGKLVLQQNTKSKTNLVLSTSTLSPGFYLLEISSEGHKAIFKVEKQ